MSGLLYLRRNKTNGVHGRASGSIFTDRQEASRHGAAVTSPKRRRVMMWSSGNNKENSSYLDNFIPSSWMRSGSNRGIDSVLAADSQQTRPDTREGFRRLIESIERSLHTAFSSTAATVDSAGRNTTLSSPERGSLPLVPPQGVAPADKRTVLIAPPVPYRDSIDIVHSGHLRGIHSPPEKLNRGFPELTLPPISTVETRHLEEPSAMEVDEVDVVDEPVMPNRIYSAHLERDKNLAESLWRVHESMHPDATEDVSERVQRMIDERDRAGDASGNYIVSETERRLRPCDNEWIRKARDFLASGRCSDSKIVIEKYDIPMNERKLSCLKPGVWLNDEVVNFYMCMLQERDAEVCSSSNPPRKPSHFFNSFFISKLYEGNQYNYKNVKRWTKKVDIFALDKIFCPINISNTHWTLAVIHMAEKRIQYYDSMAGSGAQYVKILSRYIQDEAMDKKGAANYDMSAWTLQHCDRQCTPQQQNGSDCGVFTILFADFVAANLPLSFQQSNVSECRMKICASILAGKVWYSE